MIMPMGDEEYEQFDQHKTQHGMSKAEQRRSNKPIMEKRRRARINHCLNELKSLILDAMKKDPARHSKLEKADILEMTVKHLQTVQRQQLAVAVATDPTVLHKFKTGFNECAGEVSRYIGNLEGVDVSVKQRLVSHLANCVTGLQQLSPFAFGNTNVSVFPNVPPAQQDLNNNQRNNNNNNNNAAAAHLQGLQLIPSRLPTGELALLVPNSSNMPFFPGVNHPSAGGNAPSSTVTSGTIERNHPSAFTAVNRNDLVGGNGSKSPPLSPTTSTSSDDTEQSDYQGGGSNCLTVHAQQYQAQNLQRQMNSSFVGENVGFKVPLRSPSNFKSSTLSSFHHPIEQKSPQQHSVVSSTCPQQDGATGSRCSRDLQHETYAQVKLEFKTVPIMPRGVGHTTSLPATVQQPLTVVTSQIYDIPSGSDHQQVKNPLDFSIRKDSNSFHNNNNNNNSRQCVSTQTPSIGGGKRQFPVVFEGGNSSASSEVISSSSMCSPNKLPRYSFSLTPSGSAEGYFRGAREGERHSANRATTSSAMAAAAAAAEAKENMWRPW